jgi:hypothetical protein
MWITALLQRLEAGWALPNAVRDVFAAGMPNRAAAATSLLGRALSMPDPTLPPASQLPERLGPTALRVGGSVLSVEEAGDNLRVTVRPVRSGQRGDVYPLECFVGRTLLLRSRGCSDAVVAWLSTGTVA